MKGRIKAVLFDLDGTLLDTAPDMASAANQVLREFGLPPLTERQIQANTSLGARGLLRVGFGDEMKDKDKDIDALRLSFLKHYEQNICRATRMYDGVPELLNILSQQNIPWGIMTNKPGFLTRQLLPYFPPLQNAQALVCADTLAVAKPHPEPLIHAAEQLNVRPESCIYVGDIRNDIVAAKAAGMHSAVAAWGYIDDSIDPHDWDADLIFNNIENILSLF
ncbi:phosphoglycolate phosphatase [Enterovibrio nigricans]|uniref:phosphoglycolate phosphatase n=1 Tax=Enterovibrio nigricans DSM 22720 TaxID=1121868 RepID=A0A1T4U5V1_9GAMM|nr:phosphoglycolate phosphatase [Enterovibrio nigricans]PKF51321.1 phosphoglycolate phosphatase [Enterovibrio nigricans]SKA47888.1 phosphoglycolate phosphatase [Enterovibrio nigricans DSM 22720]